MAARNYTDLTLKRLYALGGNRCAYPECDCKLMYTEGNSSDICHIEALNSGGPRYNADPDVTNKERNEYSNLILLCKTHHGIIDQTNKDKEPYYSVDQLKSMKQKHEDSMEEMQESFFNTKSPSMLVKVIKILSIHQSSPRPAKSSHPFEIEAKIEFNEVSRHYGMIRKYSVYYATLETLYNEFEPAQKTALLEIINDTYLSCLRPSQDADDLWEQIETALIARIEKEANLEYSEQLEWCVRIIMVDSFMRCKIMKEPEA